MLVGIKPTVGRISRYGVIPIAADQDTPGPMARSVTDAAILLGALESAGARSQRRSDEDVRRAAGTRLHGDILKRDGLKGARIGVPRAFYYDAVATPAERGSSGGLNDAQKAVMQDAIAVLRAQGATVVDPADIPSIVTKDLTHSLRAMVGVQRSVGCQGSRRGLLHRVQVRHEARLQCVARIARRSRAGEDTRRAARLEPAHEAAGALKYGQSQLDISDEMDLQADRARYQADRAKDVALAGREGIDAALMANQARRAAVSRQRRRGDRREAGLPDRDRSVWNGAEHVGTRRIRRKASALRRQLYRNRVQRRAAHRAGVRI